MLSVSYSPKDAKEALKKAIPSMEAGFNVNTVHGEFCLHGEDAKQVMALVAEIARKRIKGTKAPGSSNIG